MLRWVQQQEHGRAAGDYDAEVEGAFDGAHARGRRIRVTEHLAAAADPAGARLEGAGAAIEDAGLQHIADDALILGVIQPTRVGGSAAPSYSR